MVRNLSARSIVAAIGAATAAWSDPRLAARLRAREAIGERTGYSSPVVDYAIDRLFRPLTSEAIEAVIADELGSLDVLDRFVTKGGRPAARALPIGRVGILSSRTTIGVAILPAIFALSAKCRVSVKDREDRLVAAFFATLAEARSDFLELAQAAPWDGEHEAVDLGVFDCVVAFGSDRTLDAISAALPFPTRLIPYATRASAGYVAREALKDEALAGELARGAARDSLLYDGEGCLSLSVLFVERGASVSPERFCELLGAMMEQGGHEFPATPAPQLSARLAMARDVATFQSANAARVFADGPSSYLVLLDVPVDAAPPLLPRALGVRSVDDPSDALAYLTRHGIALEALAVCGPHARMRELASAAGAARIARFGELQSPPIGAFHGGRPRIAEFVRWVVDET